MRFLPIHQFNLKLPFNKEEVINRIFDNTEPSSLGKTHSQSKIFIGTFTDSTFKIKKSLKRYYENSFNPIAIGQIINEGFYCHIKVTMRPTLPTLIFMMFWIGFFLKGLIIIFLASKTISWIYI